LHPASPGTNCRSHPTHARAAPNDRSRADTNPDGHTHADGLSHRAASGIRAELIIECIFFDGLVVDSEAYGYAQILNQGVTAANLMGWCLQDVSDGSPAFTFPSYDLLPQASVRVYTNEDHPESGGFSFQRKLAAWNNNLSSLDTAGLFDPDNVLVSTKSYPPGC